MLLVSFGLLVVVASSYAKIGLGSRAAIGGICILGLLVLGELCMFYRIGARDIHFFDQQYVGLVFFAGMLFLLYLVRRGRTLVPLQLAPEWLVLYWAKLLGVSVPVILVLAIFAWPASPERIKNYVETFAADWSGDWQQWADVADWTREQKLDPDLSRPAQAALESLTKQENRGLLAIALREDSAHARTVRAVANLPRLSARSGFTPAGPKGTGQIARCPADPLARASRLADSCGGPARRSER